MLIPRVPKQQPTRMLYLCPSKPTCRHNECCKIMHAVDASAPVLPRAVPTLHRRLFSRSFVSSASSASSAGCTGRRSGPWALSLPPPPPPVAGPVPFPTSPYQFSVQSSSQTLERRMTRKRGKELCRMAGHHSAVLAALLSSAGGLRVTPWRAGQGAPSETESPAAARRPVSTAGAGRSPASSGAPSAVGRGAAAAAASLAAAAAAWTRSWTRRVGPGRLVEIDGRRARAPPATREVSAAEGVTPAAPSALCSAPAAESAADGLNGTAGLAHGRPRTRLSI